MRLLLTALFAAALPGAALAEGEPMATSEAAATAAQIDAWLREAPPVELGDDPAPGVIAGEPEARRQVHGEVGVAIGTGGYRSVYMASAIPIGEDDTLYIALSETRGGYGRYGRAYRPSGGGRRSMSLGLDLSGGEPGKPSWWAPGHGEGPRPGHRRPPHAR